VSVTVKPAERASAPPSARVDGYAPIAAYAAIGDGRTIALVANDGSIDWLPIPGLDDPTVFGALLDPEKSGCFELAPLQACEVSRRYLKDTNVLETTFTTAAGVVTVTDALNLQDGGELSWVELARSVRAMRGRVRMRYRIRPRFDFGLDRTELTRRDEVLIATQDDRIMAFRCWDAGEPVHSSGEIAGEFLAQEGGEALLVCVFVHDQPIPLPPRREIEIRSGRTADAWRRWIDFHSYDGPWREPVARSLLALKLLIDAHRGAIVAAPTTSLPEWIGSGRNYDYRFAWVRDTAFVLDALGAAGYREQVHASLSYILSATKATHPRLEPFYSIDGGVPREQVELPLAGYRGSRPVHKGNSAEGQLQLGCYGNLLETIELYVRHGNMLDDDTRVRVGEVADHVCRVWRNEDSGIWELFDLRHYTISKMHCWVALDRAIRLAEQGEAPDDRVDVWREEAARIHEWVDERCWSERKRTYTFYAGTEDLDAAVLLAVRTGYLQPSDPRLRSTIHAVRAELSAGGPEWLAGSGPLLYRYSGQRDVEGAFLPCSFWLVEALARVGELDEARETMDALLALSNDVGLYAEEIDPASGELLGNFPQGLTHLALVSAAAAYAHAQRQAGSADDERQGDEQS
jgi:GH15 family glucan-1,4-alpha-glucosidase